MVDHFAATVLSAGQPKVVIKAYPLAITDSELPLLRPRHDLPLYDAQICT
jgi:hypothetical protein